MEIVSSVLTNNCFCQI